jgi:ankyrin repeat protein
MLEHGANVSADIDGDTPLHRAVKNGMNKGSVGTLATLLKHGADVAAVDRYGRTALHIVAMSQCNEDAVKVLLEHGANAAIMDEEGMTPSALAKLHGNDAKYALLQERLDS